MVLAGPSFTVQVKSRHQKIRYESDAATTWLANQENPFFVCFADPRKSSVNLYSTCALVPGLLQYGRRVTVLEPDVPSSRENIHKDDDDILHIPLGPPVLSLTMDDVREESDLARWAEILEPWIEIDRQNIVNRRAKIHWVHRPIRHTTNQALDPGSLGVGFYWNAKNLATSGTNLLRAATLLRLEIAQLDDLEEEADFASGEQRDALNAILDAFWPVLGPTARENIRRAVPGHDWPGTPRP
ncbi:MAG: hypothetical protein V3V29_07690 [Acidimicrobiia bacterium]